MKSKARTVVEQLKAQVPGLVSITVAGDEYEALRADGQLVTEGNPDGGFVVLGVIVHRATDEATAALRQAEASIVAEKPKTRMDDNSFNLTANEKPEPLDLGDLHKGVTKEVAEKLTGHRTDADSKADGSKPVKLTKRK